MKAFILAIMIIFSGCAVMDTPYAVAKDVYTVGREVAPYVPMDAGTKASLTGIDAVTNVYDDVRTVVREP